MPAPCDPAAAPARRAERRLRALDGGRRLPSPPEVVIALVRTLSSPEIDADRVARLIGSDAAIASRLLRVANSPFYGLARRIGSVQDAVVVLGLSNVRNLVLASELMQRMARVASAALLEQFWREGTLVAFIAAVLARRTGADDGLAFTAGLLHDIGRLALAVAFDDEPPLASRCDEAPQAERHRYGIDHAEIGRALAENWHLPLEICDAIGGHHDARAALPLARVVGAADALGRALDAGHEDASMLQLCGDALVGLGARQDAVQCLAEIARDRAAARALFGTQREGALRP